MHNIKDIRNNIESFKSSLKNRKTNINFNELLDLDQKNRKIIQEKESLEQKKKEISKKQDKSLYEKSKEITKKISELSDDQVVVKEKLNSILSSIPNVAINDVPEGTDESSNSVIEKKGSIKNFDFNPKSHYELGENLNMLDFELATKTTGSRFVFVKKELALLERAISNFMLDTHTKINGYSEISPPLMATDNSMFGTGQLPKFENDQFEIKLDSSSDKKYLIPTAEVILTNMVREKILNKNDLPLRFVASTPCFRKEAGS